MRLDLLWWRHQWPPRPHVAEYNGLKDIAWIDISPPPFDISPSPFIAMLARLGDQWVSRDVPTEVGAIFQDAKGQWRKAHRVKHVRPQDWFEDDHWEVLVTFPTHFSTNHGKIEWLEDEMFPRLGTISKSDNPVFRKGDRVKIIGGGK